MRTVFYGMAIIDIAEQTGTHFQDPSILSTRSVRDALATIIDLEYGKLLALLKLDLAFLRECKYSFDIYRCVDELTQFRSNPA